MAFEAVELFDASLLTFPCGASTCSELTDEATGLSALPLLGTSTDVPVFSVLTAVVGTDGTVTSDDD